MIRILTAIALGLLWLAPLPAPAAATVPHAPGDEYSYANTDAFRLHQLLLWLDVDFTERRLRGVALLAMRRQQDTARELVLDTRQLDIARVYLVRDGGTLSVPWRLGDEDPIRGRPLTIDLPDDAAPDVLVAIAYRTSPEASGLQWVAPSATAGGEAPFLYTQSQAIHARTWVPLQDTPAVRFRFTATLQVPAGLRAVMAAAEQEPAEASICVTSVVTSPSDCFRFDMPQPIPSYLLALAVGDIGFRAIGPRTGVYAEPALLDAAAHEFADTERMLEIAESLFGAYRWGRYDLLILPPSYPYGGMENPRLSFITPTVLAGDRSLTSLIAHELAHSWSGNLVTNASWEDLWLNEGFTNLLEARLVEALYGERRRRQEDLLAYRALLEELATLSPAEQRLAADLGDGDPDDAFSGVPYEKGKLFLVFLEQRFGRERWDAFLNAYFMEFAFRSITTAEFVAWLENELLDRYPGVVSRDEVREWVYGPGLPASAPRPDDTVFAPVAAAADAWLAGTLAAQRIDTTEWTTRDRLYFLGSLPETMPAARLRELDSAFSFTSTGNNEVLAAWLKIVATNGYAPSFPRLREFLIEVGRLKYIEPLYERLMASPEGAAFARATLASARAGYHPQTVRDVERIVLGGSG